MGWNIGIYYVVLSQAKVNLYLMAIKVRNGYVVV